MGRPSNPRFLIPQLVNGRGTIPIDVSYKGVGRIRLSSGTTDDQTYIEIRQMMDDLYNHGNLTTLKSLQSKSVRPLVVLSQTKRKGIKTSITSDLEKPILETLYKWIDTTTELKDSTKKSYRGQIQSFARVVSASDTMEQLVDRLRSYRKLKQKHNFHETFNKTKAVLMSFVYEEYGRTSQLYFEVGGVDNLHRIKKTIQFGLEVSDIVALTKSAPDHISEMIWSMVFTGMRSYEYLESHGVSWKSEKVKDPTTKRMTDCIYIDKPNPGHGNKGGSRWTLNPFPDEIKKSSVQYRQFNRYLHTLEKQIGRTINQTTFRHTFVHWCQLSLIPNERISVYQGYKHKGTLGIYMGYKEHAYMDEDNERLRTYILKNRSVKVNPNAKMWFNNP